MCVACYGVSYVVNFHCCWAWQIGLYALEDCGVSSTDHVKHFGSDPVCSFWAPFLNVLGTCHFLLGTSLHMSVILLHFLIL